MTDATTIPTQRFYVTLTWDDWPEGGSYGTVVEAADHDEAEALARREMAESRAAESCFEGEEPEAPEAVLAAYEHAWHLVDCWPVDDFIAGHTPNGEAA